MPGPPKRPAAKPGHYATLGELHTHGLGALAQRNPELLGKFTQYGSTDEAIELPGLSRTARPCWLDLSVCLAGCLAVWLAVCLAGWLFVWLAGWLSLSPLLSLTSGCV